MLQPDQIYLIDKPLHWTSFDVVKFVKRHLQQHFKKKIKVGHAGTLDPLATGLLIVCTGKKTKEITKLTPLSKTYTGTIEIGKTTPSFDLETAFDQINDYSSITVQDILKVAKDFTGQYLQTPPIYSAKRVDGKRSYELARKNQNPELKPVEVHIHSFEITRMALPEIDFIVEVSKGTYIRSLAHDFGQKLGCGAYLKSLRRIAIGQFNIENALTPSQWAEQFNTP
jgi:tRNA pseudouridine55 synthase